MPNKNSTQFSWLIEILSGVPRNNLYGLFNDKKLHIWAKINGYCIYSYIYIKSVCIIPRSHAQIHSNIIL